jgi:hypothetical protein
MLEEFIDRCREGSVQILVDERIHNRLDVRIEKE